jgi:hypothetical protein
LAGVWCQFATPYPVFGFPAASSTKIRGDENFRKLVLNAILWVAKADVPKDGVKSTVTQEQLAQNLDRKGERKKK